MSSESRHKNAVVFLLSIYFVYSRPNVDILYTHVHIYVIGSSTMKGEGAVDSIGQFSVVHQRHPLLSSSSPLLGEGHVPP